MTEYITDGSETINPTLVLGYESERQARNVVHPILGSQESDVTLRPAGRRTGTLRLFFASGTASGYAWVDGYYVPVSDGVDAAEDSKAAEDLHATGEVFTLVSDLGTVAMSYVVPRGGRIRRSLDEQTRRHWVVEVDFQEVTT